MFAFGGLSAVSNEDYWFLNKQQFVFAQVFEADDGLFWQCPWGPPTLSVRSCSVPAPAPGASLSQRQDEDGRAVLASRVFPGTQVRAWLTSHGLASGHVATHL